MKYEAELNAALKAAKAVRQVILDIYNSSFDVEIKSDNSPVTIADKTADEIIRKILHEEFPDYGLLTEESVDDKSRLTNDFVFIVDPVDGTKDFCARNDQFTVNIGLAYKHEAVMGVIAIPVTGEIFYAVKDGGSYYLKDNKVEKIHVNDKLTDLKALVSNFHSTDEERALFKKYSDRIKYAENLGSSIKGCAIAKGDAEISYRFSENTKEWDTCAMQIILEEAGGHLLKFDGTPIRYNREDVYNHGGYVLVNRKENFLL